MLQRYNHTIQKFLDGSVDPEDLKVMLLDNNVTFDATDTSVSTISNTGAYEVYGNGWTQGGESLTSSVGIVSTNGAALLVDPLEVEADGGDIGPAYHALVFYGDIPLFLETPTNPQTASEGTPMLLPFSSGRLFQVTEIEE